MRTFQNSVIGLYIFIIVHTIGSSLFAHFENNQLYAGKTQKKLGCIEAIHRVKREMLFEKQCNGFLLFIAVLSAFLRTVSFVMWSLLLQAPLCDVLGRHHYSLATHCFCVFILHCVRLPSIFLLKSSALYVKIWALCNFIIFFNVEQAMKAEV